MVHDWWPRSFYQIKAVTKPAFKRCGDHSPGPTDLESQGSINKYTLTTRYTHNRTEPLPSGGSRGIIASRDAEVPAPHIRGFLRGECMSGQQYPRNTWELQSGHGWGASVLRGSLSLEAPCCPAPRARQQGRARAIHDHHSASPIQVIQEVSGLPYEGAAEGNQYTPDAQRLNCQKVRLRPAQSEDPILCRLSKNSELKWKASFFIIVL